MNGQHRCPRRGCNTLVPDALFACYRDWQALPRPIKVRIGQTAGMSILSVARRQVFEAARRAWDEMAAESGQ